MRVTNPLAINIALPWWMNVSRCQRFRTPNSVKAVGTRAEDAMERASYAHHLGLVSDPAE
jgi:hypothetical protein